MKIKWTCFQEKTIINVSLFKVTLLGPFKETYAFIRIDFKGQKD